MQKLFKRSLAMVLALMMVLSMFAGAMADTLEPFTSSSEMGTPLFHIANAGLENFADDALAINMQYLAQHFVPATSTISGVKLAMNYGDGQGVMHVEIREGDANGTAIFTKEIDVTAQGDGAAWYTLDFGEDVAVTAGAKYAFAFWFSSKTTTGFAIAHGAASAADGLDLWRYKRYNDADTVYAPTEVTLKTTGQTVGFEILSNEGQETPTELSFRNCDETGWQNTPRGEFYKDTTNYVEGTGSILVDLDHRTEAKLMNAWLGSIDGRTANTDTLDISGLYNENGEFYLAFDMWADPEYINSAKNYTQDTDTYLGDVAGGLNAGRFVVGLICHNDAQVAQLAAQGKNADNMDSSKESIEIDKVKGTDWSIWGLENGLQAGWNHLAIKITDKDGSLSYAKSGNEAYWDPTNIWGIRLNYRQLNWTDPLGQNGTVQIRFDDIRFMSVEAYEANFASDNKIKDAIGAINEIESDEDAEGIAAAKTAYAALTAEQKAEVTNYSKLQSAIAATTDLQFRNCDKTEWWSAGRGKLYSEASQYTEGTASVASYLDHRSGSKIMNAWLGSIDSRSANTDTLDISSIYNENGEFYLTFDMWADPDYLNSAKNYTQDTDTYLGDVDGGLNAGRFVVGLICHNDAQVAQLAAQGKNADNMDSSKESIEIDKVQGTDWSIWGLENGLQPGWNHLAIKLTDNGETVTNMKTDREAYWDPTTIWGIKFNYQQLNWTDPSGQSGTVKVLFDDIRFMSVEAYETKFESRNNAKDVIAAINDIEGADDQEAIDTANAAYADLTDAEKAMVTNYSILEGYAVPVDMLLESVESNFGDAHITIGAGPQDNTPYAITPSLITTNYTEGNGAGKIQWAGTDNKTMHISFINTSGTWDFSQAQYIALDMYVHGFTITNDGDQNFGFGTSGTWSDQNLGWIGRDTLKDITAQLTEGWNRIILPIPAAAQTSGVKNFRLFSEGGISFNVAEGEKAYAILDDVRALNDKGLEIDAVRDVAKTVIVKIAGAQTAEDVVAAREAYVALTEEQQAYVTNLAVLETLEVDVVAAAAVEAQITALTDITYADKADVEAARAAYDALTDAGKAMVSNVAALEAAEAIIATEQAAADAVVEQINALPAVDVLDYKVDQATVIAARDAYNALAEDTKVAVTNLDVLEAAEAEIQRQIDDAGEGELAAAIDTAIEALPAAADIKVADEAAINAAEKLYNDAADEVKALVKEENVAKLAAVKEALAAQKEAQTQAAPVVEQIAALRVTSLDDKAAVEAASAAYDALSDSAKYYVTNKDALDAAVAAIAALEKEIVDAAALAEQINALPEKITVADKADAQVAIDAYEAASDAVVALLDDAVKAKYVATKAAVLNMAPYEIQIRGFEKQLSDYNLLNSQVFVGKTTGTYNIPAVGTGYMGGKYNTATNEFHHYVYAYNQNKTDNADGSNADGVVKFYVDDPTKLYISFDLYLSDASVVNNPAGDCGFGLDTAEFGTFENWNSTFTVKRVTALPVVKEFKDGWNHVILPLSLCKSSFETAMAGQVITIRTMRFFINGVAVPAGFVSAIDDVRFMNEEAAQKIYPLRTAAKNVTDMIRAYPAEPTADDFYAVYLAYNGVDDDYKDLIIGWDAFIEANAEFKAAADEKIAVDQAAAAPVIEAIAALDKVITVDDEAAIVAAEDALANLTDDQKVLVNNASILTAARTALDAAKEEAADQAAADAVIEMILALPATVSDTDVADEDEIKAVRTAYDALTDAQKQLIDIETYNKLVAAEENIIIVYDMAAAAAVEALIDALPTPTDVTADDKEAVEAAAEAYGALTAAQKGYLSADAAEKLAACVAALADITSVKMGDLDGDGEINAKDALIALKIAVGKYDATDAQKVAGDVNEDGNIDAKDALEMLKFAVGKPSKLDKFYPVEA